MSAKKTTLRREGSEKSEMARARREKRPRLEHDGYPAVAIGTHKRCRLGMDNTVLEVHAPKPYKVCGCDELMDVDVVLYKKKPKPPRRPPYLTFCPYKVYNNRNEMQYTVEIVQDRRDGTEPKRQYLSVIDVSWSAAEELRVFLEKFFKKHEGRHVWRAGSMIRREIEQREKNLKGHEKQANEERVRIERLNAELRQRGDRKR